MAVIAAEKALLAEGWERDVRLHIEQGKLKRVERGAKPAPGDERHDLLLPGMPNLHSHAFQLGMSGLAEQRGPGTDTFWSWRTIMYRFALTMAPEDVEAVAAMLYVLMLEAGFTRIGEFHYLHHQPDGSPYDNPAELGERIASACGETGINLTLLPSFYAHSNFGGLTPTEGQRRFISTLDQFARLHEGCARAIAALPESVIGIAPHSLRAVTGEELQALVAAHPDGPVHIHAAEQVKEVDDCLAATGRRPVEWLLDNMPVNQRWCLIHSTHMTKDEVRGLALSGAVAGLCPITEGNLGDGIFEAEAFRSAGGHFGIGSDSNVLISIAAELRQLEYSQRLKHLQRNMIAPPGRSTGRTLFDEALAGGSRALGKPSGLQEGANADFLSLDRSAAPWLDEDAAIDGWIFGQAIKPDCVWTRGVKRVSNGQHIAHEAIAARFRKAMISLCERGY